MCIEGAGMGNWTVLHDHAESRYMAHLLMVDLLLITLEDEIFVSCTPLDLSDQIQRKLG